MELEVEDTDKKFKFLSSEIKVNKENFRIRSRFYNKNQRQIEATQFPKGWVQSARPLGAPPKAALLLLLIFG